MNVLVTGATGAIGADLVPRLAAAGHRVRAFARDPSRVTDPAVSEVVRGDAVAGTGLDAALAGIDVAYFLIHSMETSAADPRRRGSRTATGAPRRSSPPRRARRACGASSTSAASCPPARAPSAHLASRLEVEETLLAAAPEAVALRASIVIGARSRSFRFLVRLVERVPVMPLPDWREHRTRRSTGAT